MTYFFLMSYKQYKFFIENMLNKILYNLQQLGGYYINHLLNAN